jgi:hypothetical protein
MVGGVFRVGGWCSRSSLNDGYASPGIWVNWNSSPSCLGERLVSSLLSRNMNQLELASPEYSSVARIKSNQCLCRNTHQLDRLTSNYVVCFLPVRWTASPQTMYQVSSGSPHPWKMFPINRIESIESIAPHPSVTSHTLGMWYVLAYIDFTSSV